MQSYNVYRGGLSSLVDADGDGIVDGGYGACLFDSDNTDTKFIDREISSPAGAGFFYLKSIIDGQGEERGLGATSDGRLREVAAACP